MYIYYCYFGNENEDDFLVLVKQKKNAIVFIVYSYSHSVFYECTDNSSKGCDFSIS